MYICAYLIIGFIVGSISTVVIARNGLGPLGDIFVGLIGAVIGGFGFRLLGSTIYGVWDSLVTSVFGAVILLIIVRSTIGFRNSKSHLSKS